MVLFGPFNVAPGPYAMAIGIHIACAMAIASWTRPGVSHKQYIG